MDLHHKYPNKKRSFISSSGKDTDTDKHSTPRHHVQVQSDDATTTAIRRHHDRSTIPIPSFRQDVTTTILNTEEELSIPNSAYGETMVTLEKPSDVVDRENILELARPGDDKDSTDQSILQSKTLVNNNTTVEDRVRERCRAQQEQDVETSRRNATDIAARSDSTSTIPDDSTSHIDPHFLLRVTDALWSYLITTKFRQIQQQKQAKIVSTKNHNHIESIQPQPKTTITTSPTKSNTNLPFNDQICQYPTLVLKDVVVALRQTMLTTVFGKSMGSSGTSSSSNTLTEGIQANSSSTGTSSSSTISKRDIVHALLELYSNPNINPPWITLYDPHTRQRLPTLVQQSMHDRMLLPNTIVQVNSQLTYQTIRNSIGKVAI
jgi:hypothetical protein